MTPQMPQPASKTKLDDTTLPKGKWWGRYVVDGNPPRRRFVLQWSRILGVVGALCVMAYLSLATALWGYYSMYRKIPGVQWIDIVVLPRFSHVEDAIADDYFSKAKDAWKAKDYLNGIFKARAAVQKSPSNLEARLFLAGCWSQVGRREEAMRTLSNGIKYSATDPKLQQQVIAVFMDSGRYKETLKLLHEDFPAHGVNLLDGKNPLYRLVEIRATLESGDPRLAASVAAGYPELSASPQAAPLLARIDAEQGRGDQALSRLIAARKKSPSDPTIMESYANIAKRFGKMTEARAAARTYLAAYPNRVAAQLCVIEMYGSRKGDDVKPWTGELMVFLSRHRKDADSMAQLASLSASQGWTDVSYLLYENSLAENLTGLPFAVFYAASLVKAGNVAAADEVWHQLAIKNGSQVAAASYVGAMIAKAAGREAEAEQIIQTLRRETANDAARRHGLQSVFKTFGFPKLATELAADGA